MREEFYRKLTTDKIKINRNLNPIRMDLFLSFLNVDVIRSRDHLGSCTGWTKLFNAKCDLEIGGGYVGDVEWLDSLRYKKDLHNPYNNFVSPFNLFDIMNDAGKDFFFDYYKDDIKAIIKNIDDEIETYNRKGKLAKESKTRVLNEIKVLKK